MSVLIYTFWVPQGVITKVLSDFQDQYTIIYTKGMSGLAALEAKILHLRPNYILGLGYYRRGTKKIRSEQVFQNRHGKSQISASGPEVYRTNRMIKADMVMEANAAGCGPCNWYGYKTLQILEANGLNETKFGYLHVPRDYDQQRLKETLEGILTVI
jgi:pyrrolidone-carboxylate peptidase